MRTIGPLSQADTLAAIADDAGLRRIHIVAWRDLADVEAGGSEIHAAEIAKRWAAAGLEVTMRTSYAQGQAPIVRRDGYRVVRRAGRYLVFPRAALSELVERHGAWDALVEVWNGMPFFSPLWSRGRPRVVVVHHLHAEMWRMVLPDNPNLAQAGELLERRIAPLLYRWSKIVTPSDSSKAELVAEMRLRAERIAVVPPGVDSRFSPGGERAPFPLVVAVGRLVPVKRYDVLIDALASIKHAHPTLRAVIVGEGYERPALEELLERHRARSWIDLPGHLDDAAVVDLYRRAWVVASSSAREGWGMSITEAGACGTPAVATRIGGHVDSVVDGETGLLAAPDELAAKLDAVLTDEVLRKELGEGALARAVHFTWDASARGVLEALAGEARRRRTPDRPQ